MLLIMKRLSSIAALLVAAPAAAQLVIPAPVPPPFPLPGESLLMLGNAQSRLTVPVTINRRGPWPFIIDTGSQRTVVSRELAGVLGLGAGPARRIVALTGTSDVSTVIVPALGFSTVLQDTIEAPALLATNIGAAGMLGVDALQGQAVSIDFTKHVMTLKPSAKRRIPAANGEIVVIARSVFGQLIVSNAQYHGMKIAVVIDTGSPTSIGNRALLSSMRPVPRMVGPISITSVTGQNLAANAYVLDRLDIGGVGFANVPVAIADGPAFDRLGLAEKPAMLLGMDALRLFRIVKIDFTNREIRFTFPRSAIYSNFGY